MRILLAEDDHMVGRTMRVGLERAGYAADWVLDGRSALASLCDEDYDLAILDLGLPELEGMQVLDALRRAGKSTPVVIATARDGVPDRIAGLDGGADDYVLKPFDLDELIARIRAILRRHGGRAQRQLACGELCLDPVARAVTWRGAPLDVSLREFALLEALLRADGAFLSRRQLESAIYSWGTAVDSNAVEVHVHHLRRKLGRDVIKNVRGMGYRIAAT
ncbi:MAG: response regulator transcription factor [Proteobacteria bacterium]|nr:response regulator transcription factor [Pseudomonadota bacterium]